MTSAAQPFPRPRPRLGALAGQSAWRLLLAAGLWSACAAPAWADGDTRPATPQEKAYHARVMGVCQKAATAGPAGWEQVDRSETPQLEQVSTGLGKSPWPLTYRLAWQDSARLRAGEEKALQAGIALLERQKADKTATELQKQADKLANAMGAAMNKGDMPEGLRLRQQMEPYLSQLQAIHEDRDRQFEDILRENQPKDARASLSIHINSLGEEFTGPLAALPPLAGAQAWRTQGAYSPNQGWREGVTVVLLGEWTMDKAGDSTILTAKTRPGLPATTVQTVVVRLSAGQDRARQMLESLDWAQIKDLLGK